MSVYKKLQDVSVALQETKMKKSGKNKFAGFSYFELGDFLPTVNQLFQANGLCGYVSFDSEIAMLTITDVEDGSSVEVCSPMVTISMKGANEIQNLGAVQTYQRRYLYMAALGITENDVVDSQEMKHEKKQEPKATVSQVKQIVELLGADVEKADKVRAHYKVKEFKDLTMENASQCLKQLNK
ncbi:Erf-like ssDNA annealing protein [PinkBerry-associated phage LS06-2018-MD08]|nr:Erf-like ssDNA annealing protein [PinkBerry-associated phage LS06-2018-MD08]